MLDNLKISGKLFLGFGVVLALLAFVSLFNLTSANKISRQIDHVKNVSYNLATETIDTINRTEKILSLVLNASEAANQAPLEKARETKADVDNALQELGRELPTDSDTYHELIGFIKTFNACFEAGSQMTNFAVEQDFIQFVSAREVYQNNFTEFEKSAKKLKEMVSKTLYEDLLEINAVSDSNVRSSGYLTLAGLVLGIILAVAISSNISKPMKQVVEVIGKIGDGDLNQKIGGKRGDEIGQVSAAMDDMADKLRHMVEQLRQSISEFGKISQATTKAADTVDSTAKRQSEGVESISVSIQQIDASIDSVTQNIDSLSVSAADSTTSSLEMAASIEEVAENSLQLSKAVEEISSSISEMASTINQVAGSAEVLKQSSVSTASTVEEMDNNIRQVEEHARETSQTTSDVRRDAEAGKASVDKTIAGINQIKTSSKTTSDAVGVLADKVKDIGSILAVIAEVTEQTNLLALNAAIISAQAGVHGRGFAVVAEEIRDLSERTSASTREIEAVIADIQKETARAVDSIQQTEASIVEGENLSLKSGEMLDKIVAGAQGSASRVDQIVRAATEQAQASHMMRKAVESVSEMAGHIASATREQDQGAKSITSATQTIADLTEFLKNSTREQSQTSHTIGQSMEKMNDLVQQIKVACYQQKDGSKNIVNAMEDIKDSSRGNISSVESLNQAVERLQSEIAVLHKEMSAFKVARDPGTKAEQPEKVVEVTEVEEKITEEA